MLYKKIFVVFILFFFTNCTTGNLAKNKPNYKMKSVFKNRGFTLIYNEKFFDNKIITKKIGQRDLIIFQKNLKKNTSVKITNILNNKSLIAKVGGRPSGNISALYGSKKAVIWE